MRRLNLLDNRRYSHFYLKPAAFPIRRSHVSTVRFRDSFYQM
jgi:hypothetical protein